MDYTKIKALIYSSFILYCIDNLLEKKDQSKGSVIRLRQALAAKTVSSEHKEIAELSNRVWADTIKEFKDKRMRIVVGDLIETLMFSEDKAFMALYGAQIINIAGYATVKMVDEGISSEIIKESREVTKKLIDLTRKYVYDYNVERKR